MNAPNDFAHRGNSVILFFRQLCPFDLRIHLHAAEFQNHKNLFIPGKTRLLIKHRATIIKLNRKRDHQHKWRCDHQHQQRKYNIHKTLAKQLLCRQSQITGKKKCCVK